MTQLQYYQGKAEADKAEKINRDKIRAIEINKSNLFQNTSELFKPIVTKQQESITDQQAASKKSLEMFNYVPGVKRPIKSEFTSQIYQTRPEDAQIPAIMIASRITICYR